MWDNLFLLIHKIDEVFVLWNIFDILKENQKVKYGKQQRIRDNHLAFIYQKIVDNNLKIFNQ
jgi:hypothetical protein